MSLVENKKARFNYEILETLEVGLELTGAEVKSLRKGQASLEGSRVIIDGDEATLVGAYIAPYQPKNQLGYDPERPRRLLIKKEEIKELLGKGKMKRLTIIPLSVYNKKRYLKLSIALVRGKRKFDKRDSIKKRDTERDLGRSLKS